MDCSKKARPVFLIYKPDIIPCLKEMINYWNQLCEKEGMGYIYLLGENNKSIVQYLKNNNFESVAVYGLRMIGMHLVTELQQSDFKMEYGIDKGAYDDIRKCNYNRLHKNGRREKGLLFWSWKSII